MSAAKDIERARELAAKLEGYTHVVWAQEARALLPRLADALEPALKGLEFYGGEVDRLVGERDAAQSRVDALEGENRQLRAYIVEHWDGAEDLPPCPVPLHGGTI